MTEEEFRSDVRTFLERAWSEMERQHGEIDSNDPEIRHEFENKLCAAGLSGLSWPRKFGGRELPTSLIAAFHEEYGRFGAPQGVNTIGHGIMGPTLLLFGSEEQKERFLPRIVANDEIWCQGYSEPGAGSDLAALKTSARREGDEYVINGQKIWTSWAHKAHWCFLLARTDPQAPKHKGISFLLVDMTSPGVEVRPIRQISGEQEFNEVFFENVRIPVTNRIGEENDGWRIAMGAASYERATYFIPRLVRMEAELHDLIAIASEIDRGRRPLIEDQRLRDGFARSFIDVTGLKLHAKRMLAAAERHEAPGPEGSYIKLMWSESHQRLLDLALVVLGPEVGLGPSEPTARRRRQWQRDHLWSRAETILAGTSEIQRNVVGERVLGLPR